ncbi:hypothetical protein [Streptomyces griseocarneus]|uniref:hypothetical protein n=1 Tax=Streptomyces griseocarneus TaxID=51201 RepID=UPI00167CFA69|nr:hypothetical protein [Streptomyces griseocarneus]MBZ6476967.1 hypothetical protein [Streptomyces griseocarneus]GHG76439.1 hypothetical protein GCM10018779_54750 [Streptomyces griseocarneus]
MPDPRPAEDLSLTTQAAKDAARAELAIELPKLKTEILKDATLQGAKGDFSGAAFGAQIFKFDQSLWKWDEKGLTFAGKEVQWAKKLSLQNVIHGKKNREKAEQGKQKERQKEEAAKAELQAIKDSALAAGRDARDAKRNAETAHRNAQQSVTDASRAKHDADTARNLASSARRNTELAATGSREARESAKLAKQSSEQTRKVAKEFLRAMQHLDVQAGGSTKNIDSFKRALKELERQL